MNVRDTANFGEVCVLPFRVIAPVRESLEWLTNVIVHQDGTEQRLRIRTAPRHEFELASNIPPSLRQFAFNAIYGGMTRLWAMPVWPDNQRVGPQDVGAQTISGDFQWYDFRPGGLAILWESETEWELLEVASFSSNGLSLSVPLTQPFLNPMLMPVLTGRITPKAQRQITSAAQQLGITFRVDEYKEIVGPVLDEFEGLEFFDTCPLLPSSAGLVDDVLTRTDLIDPGIGVVAEFNPWLNARRSRLLKTTLKGPQAAWEFREWVHRRAGRWGEFAAPSFEADFTLRSTGLLGDVLELADNGYTEYATARTGLGFRLTDGTMIKRRILSQTNTSNESVIVTLDSAVGVQATQVETVQYVGTYRLDTDRVELLHTGAGILQCEMAVLELSP